jgi:DNA-binding LacI/PurR family transcriptional regulator
VAKKQGQISQHVRQRILAGDLKAGDQLPAQTALAKQFRVSPVTVQRSIDLLARQGFVRTQRRGGTFVADRPPHLCRYGLVFIDTPGDPTTWTLYHNALANEGVRLAKRDGIQLSTYHGVLGHVDEADYRRLLEDVREGLVGGIIITSYPSPLLRTPLLQDPDLPRVAIMGLPEIPGIPRVFGDIEGLIDRSLDWLKAQGRKRVAVLASLGMYTHCPDHYLPALRRSGFPAEPCWVQVLDRRPPEAANHAVQLLMRLPRKERPDALLVLDDNLVEHACAGLVAAGVRVPDDVTVVAQCNFPWPPPAVLPLRRIGFDAGEMLAACIDSINRQRLGETVEAWTRIPAVFEDERPT